MENLRSEGLSSGYVKRKLNLYVLPKYLYEASQKAIEKKQQNQIERLIKNEYHHTCFRNPLFKSFYLNCGDFGNIPARGFGTTNEYPEFLEYCQNAMNMNGEQSGFNKEVVASLTNNELFSNNKGNYSNDRTSFFIGLPTETDNTYQHGLTSLSPINFEMNVAQDTGEGTFANKVEAPPLLCILFDSSISILVQPNVMPPLVRFGNYDLFI